MVATLLRRRLWWAGTGAAVTGYAFQAVALAYGSLILVARCWCRRCCSPCR